MRAIILFPPFRRGPAALSRFARAASGGVAAMGAIMLPALVGAMALGAEAGYWKLSQRKLQHAADLAAYAAAVQIRSGETAASAAAAARDAAGASGFRAGEDVIRVSTPPTTGGFTGDAQAAEVVLRRSQTRYFSLIYANDDVAISARAVARYEDGGDACVLALSRTAAAALRFGGSTTATFDGCESAANSNAAEAVRVFGSASLTTDCLRSVGGADISGTLNTTQCPGVRTSSPPIRDPYADFPAPEPEGPCSSGDVDAPSAITAIAPDHVHSSGVQSRNFCGGLTLRGSVTFAPGVYFVGGGDFRINAGAVVAGVGVSFVLGNGAEIKFNGGAEISVAAPTTGAMAGMLIYGDPADNGLSHSLNGGATSIMSGAIYLPSGALFYAGGFGLGGLCVQLVADTVEFTGSASLNIDCTPAGAQRIAIGETIALVE